jgi:hypothetical protein
MIAGCGSKWTYSYIEAERKAAAEERDILVIYRDHLDFSSADLEDAMQSPVLEPVTKDYVLCSLVSAYAPNRRYVAQFGVASPPAVIVVHPDGTYHAQTERLTPEDIRSFLAGAQAPGQRADRDIAVPRATDYLLRAEGVYERAVEKANRLNRPLLIIYKWWLDDESTRLIARMSRPEVAARCASAVHCILDWDYVPNRRHVARYGVGRYPAIIVVHRDGSADVLDGPASAERIIGFLSRTLPPVSHPTADAAVSPAKPAWRWFSDYERARARARTSGAGLFVFVHNPTDEASARVMRLLQSDEAADLLSHTVNCSLTDRPVTRELLAVHSIERAPTCLAIRPDGDSRKREGVITMDDLRELADYLK